MLIFNYTTDSVTNRASIALYPGELADFLERAEALAEDASMDCFDTMSQHTVHKKGREFSRQIKFCVITEENAKGYSLKFRDLVQADGQTD